MFFLKTYKKILADKHLFAQWGQKQCEKFLKARGFKIISRNFSCRMGELDIVAAEPKGAIVFVEVKTRKNEAFVDAEASITPAKRVRMERAAKLFVRRHNLEDIPLRFDVMLVIADGETKPQIRHYINAF